MSVNEMIKNFEEYKTERYKKLELEFLRKSGEFFSKNFAELRKNFLINVRSAIKNAVETQKIEKKICAYISVSFLNTSVIEKNPTLQIDFYDEDWFYGKSWARSRHNADFLLKFWESFTADALDESFYIRSQVSKVEIKSLFWGTLDKLIYIFACNAKYFGFLVSFSDEYDELQKAENFYITCGTYLDWQERIFAELPEVDLLNLEKNFDTTFRPIKKKFFRGKSFENLNLRHCFFEDCIFDKFIFSDINLCDAQFLRCKFFSTKFLNCQFAGGDFFECNLKDCDFENCSSEPEDAAEDEYFANFRMYHCYLLNVNFLENKFSQLNKIHCVEK
ncbi:MAG: hypothetical protein IK062_08780 [Selenomonadaceae bacterium]|nr:hypothetical protein [Selenomonadaceae bacterium]